MSLGIDNSLMRGPMMTASIERARSNHAAASKRARWDSTRMEHSLLAGANTLMILSGTEFWRERRERRMGSFGSTKFQSATQSRVKTCDT